MADTIFVDTISAIRAMARGAESVAVGSLQAVALRKALRELYLAEIVCGPWQPLVRNLCGPSVDDLTECCIGADDFGQIDWDKAVCGQSRIDDSFYSVAVGHHQWIVESEPDGAPDGHTTYHVRLRGNA